MRKLLKRWYVWLALFLLLGLASSAALIYSSRGRISQANFERIRNGMTEEEVTEIIGEPDWNAPLTVKALAYPNGPNYILLIFDHGKVHQKEIYLASEWEILEWYAKKSWRKIIGAGH
jgi:hypothetical protein